MVNDQDKSKEQLLAELSSMRQQLSGLEVLQSATRELHGTIDQLADELGRAKQQAQELQSVYAAGQVLSETHDLRRGLMHILEQLKQVVSYDSASILELAGDRLRFIAGAGMADLAQLRDSSYPIPAGSPIRKVIDRCAPVLINDLQSDTAGAALDEQSGGLRSWLGLPLLYGGRLSGIFSLGHTQPAVFGEQHIRRAAAFSTYAAIVVEHNRLRNDLEQRSAELDMMLQASLSLTASLDLQEVLDSIVHKMFKLVHGPKDIHVFLYENGQLLFGSAIWDGKAQSEPINRPRKGGLTYSVAESGEPLMIEDMATHPIYANAPADWQGAIVGLPLKIGSRVVGVMNFTYPQAYRLSDEELRLLMTFANQAAIGIENARLYAAAQQELVQHRRAEAERARLQEEVIRVQAQTLAELSTPLIPISDKVVVMPLIGATDQQRAQRLLETLLRGVGEYRARITIVDITGVPVVDSHVASTIMAAARAVRLLGAEVVLTGIRPEVAETLIGLGANFRGIKTYSSLQAGVSYALGL